MKRIQIHIIQRLRSLPWYIKIQNTRVRWICPDPNIYGRDYAAICRVLQHELCKRKSIFEYNRPSIARNVLRL